jgi:hypothetical protein
MRRALVVVAAIVALAVVGFFVAVPIVIDRNLSAEAVAERATELFGRPTTVERVGVAFVPALRIRAEGVVVEGGASADAVEVEIAVLPLLRRRVEPHELHLRGPRLLLERGPDGGIRARLFHRPGADEADEADEGEGGLPPLPELEASDGELALVDAAGRPTPAPVLRIRRLELDRLDDDGRAPLHLDVALDPGPDGRFGIASFDLEGVVEATDGDVALRSGRAEGRDLLARGLRFPRLEARFEYASRRVAVESLSLSGYDGGAEASGTFHLGRPARFEGRVEASGLALAPMVADWRGRPLDTDPGVLDARGDVAWDLAARERSTGSGEIEMVRGELPAGSIFSALLGTIGRLTGRILSLGDAVSPAPSKLERLTAPFDLRDDTLRTDALRLETDDYVYDASGTLGLDDALDLSGTVQLTGRGLQRMLVHGALSLPGGKAVIPAVPLRVTGRLGSPSVSADATGLPGAAQATLGGLVRGGAGVVQGAAEGGKAVVEGAAEGGKAVVDKVLGR